MLLLFENRIISVERRVNLTIDGNSVILDNALEAPFVMPRRFTEPVRLTMADTGEVWFAANAIKSSLDGGVRLMKLRIADGVLNAEEMW